MEVVSEKFMKGLRDYWRKRRGGGGGGGEGYERIDGAGRRRKIRVEVLGGGRAKKRSRIFRIRVAPKFRFLRACSPKKLLVRLRDAYVNMMLGFANSRVLTTSYGGAVGEGIFGYGYGAGYGLKGPRVKDYDEKMLVEIYKLMIAQQGQFTGRELARAG